MIYDFTNLSDYELESQYKSLSLDLDGRKTYWNAEEVKRDHRRWKALKEEIAKRVFEEAS